MADVWANSMACHPRATYHIAGCCHLVNSLSRFQSTCHIAICRVQSPNEINVVIVPHCRCKSVVSLLYKTSILHIENHFSPYFIILFSMQFRLWRAAAFVSSPIHLVNVSTLRLSYGTGRPSVCLHVVCNVSLLRPTQRVEHIGNTFALSDSLWARTVCLKMDSSWSCKLNGRGMKNWRFRPIARFIWQTVRCRILFRAHLLRDVNKVLVWVYGHSYNGIRIGTRKRSIEWWYIQWPWTILSDLQNFRS